LELRILGHLYACINESDQVLQGLAFVGRSKRLTQAFDLLQSVLGALL